MTVKEQWYDKFMDLLWGHHTCDWPYANSNPDYPYQLAVAYFDWYDWETQTPERTPEEAFARYLEGEKE